MLASSLYRCTLAVIIVGAAACVESPPPFPVAPGSYAGTFTLTVGDDTSVRAAKAAVLELGADPNDTDLELVVTFESPLHHDIDLYMEALDDVAILSRDTRGYVEIGDVVLETESLVAFEEGHQLVAMLSGYVRNDSATAAVGTAFFGTLQAGYPVVSP